jgi:hypothetical protein
LNRADRRYVFTFRNVLSGKDQPMKLKPTARAGLGTATGSLAMLMLAAPPAAASPLFDGGGRGPTAQVAIQSALEDAQTTAQSVGFYGACTIVGEPQVFESTNDPNFGHVFRAQVRASCEA